MDSWRDMSLSGVPEVDVTRPNQARMYDYALGGGHNFEVDRELADRVFAIMPSGPHVARTNRGFLRQAVRYCLDQGITQFLDLGSGIPSAGNVHEIALEANPRNRVVYVDNEAVAVAHTRQILSDEPHATIVQADLRTPRDVLGAEQTRRLIDFDQPVAVLMVAVLHYVSVEDGIDDIMRVYLDQFVSGSHLAISHTTADNQPESSEGLRELSSESTTPITHRSRDKVAALFDPWELVEPGVVWTPQWHPNPDDAIDPHPERSETWAGVARKP